MTKEPQIQGQPGDFRRQQLVGQFLVWLIVVAPAIIDWIHGFLAATAGIEIVASLYRFSLLAIGFVILAIRPSWTMLLISALYFFYLIASYLTWSVTTTIYLPEEVIRSANIVFLPFCVWTLFYCSQFLHVKTDWIIRQIITFGKIAALIVVLSLVFNIGTPTYFSPLTGSYGFGTKSYYFAGNVLGLSLVIALATSLIVLIEAPKLRRYLDTALILVGAVSVGSRAGTIIAPLLLLIAAGYFVFFRSGYRAQRFTVVALVLPVLVIGGIKTYEIVSDYSYMATRIESLAAGEVRASHSAPAWEMVKQQNLSQRLVGSSFEEHARSFAFHTPKKGVLKATAETDPVDVLGAYGVAGLLALYLPYAIALLMALLAFVRTRSTESTIALVCLSLLIGHSVIAGHVVFSSQTTQLASIFVFLGIIACRHSTRTFSTQN